LAKTVYTVEEFSLADGKVVKVAPLPISKLKKAMAALETTVAEETDGVLDYILNAAGICLEGQLDEDYVLGDTLDIVTAKRVIAVCTGYDMDAPNLLMEAAAAQAGASLT
jgi:hypothetical protein